MKERAVPADVLARLRLVCLDLPEAREETAWAGVRWVVSRKNFAHVVMIDEGWPPAYAHALGSDGPACVVTFRVPKRDARSPRYTRPPFFKPPWFSNIVGLTLDARTDWDELATALRTSFCVLAPRKLAELVEP
jgi:hypothetical protein